MNVNRILEAYPAIADEADLKNLRAASREKNTAAMTRLAVCRAFGRGVPVDKRSATRGLKQAAELGDPVAACLLGLRLHTNALRERNTDRKNAFLLEAEKWLQISSRKGLR